MNFIKNQYKQVAKFFKTDVIGLFVVCLLSFLGLSVMSHFLFMGNQTAAQEIIHTMMASFDESGLNTDNNFLMMWGLLKNNVVATLSATALGVIPCAFLPIIVIASNGIIIGMVTSFSVSGGQGGLFLAAGLLPHGIFEIPALALSVALGLNLCLQLTRKIFSKAGQPTFIELTRETLRSYLLTVLPLLLIAAFVEAFITGAVINLV
ncbi:MAG: stage II sporulation protein M, partial [Oscillospiraceae bacterium]